MAMMNRCVLIAGLHLAISSTTLAASGPGTTAMDWSPIGSILGQPGALGADGAFRVNLLRTDIVVKDALGMTVPAGAGLFSYAAFAGTPVAATVIGDTCMVETEVQQVIGALRDGGIEVVALHNHMLGESPRLAFLHFQGRGDAATLAKTIRAAWDRMGKPLSAVAGTTPDVKVADPARASDWKPVGELLGRAGTLGADGVYKVTFPRSDLSVTLDAQALPPGVGLASWAAFYSAPGGGTMVMGDTCVTREELQGALDALRHGGMKITAIHNHLLGERTQVMFMHYEGMGEAAALAGTIRAAWDRLGGR